MRAWLVILASFGAACGHTSAATDKPAALEQQEPAEQPTAKRVRSSEGTPLSTSPAGALAPGALGDIRARLIAAGHLESAAEGDQLDPPTERALRAFQKERDLPATGVPDEGTLRALGLDPGKVLRKAKEAPP